MRLLMISAALGAIAAAAAVAFCHVCIEEIDFTPLEQRSRVLYAADGSVAAYTLSGDTESYRFYTQIHEVSPLYLRMLLASEDRNFFSHPGVDFPALIRAAFTNVRSGRISSGGSTIAMQVAKRLTGHERTYLNKLKEVVQAIYLTRKYGRRQILEWYLTLAPFGSNIEGVKAASLKWFSHLPSTLSPSEAALLTALPRAPEIIRPDRNVRSAVFYKNEVLRLSHEKNVISYDVWQSSLGDELPDHTFVIGQSALSCLGEFADAAVTPGGLAFPAREPGRLLRPTGRDGDTRQIPVSNPNPEPDQEQDQDQEQRSRNGAPGADLKGGSVPGAAGTDAIEAGTETRTAAGVADGAEVQAVTTDLAGTDAGTGAGADADAGTETRTVAGAADGTEVLFVTADETASVAGTVAGAGADADSGTETRADAGTENLTDTGEVHVARPEPAMDPAAAVSVADPATGSGDGSGDASSGGSPDPIGDDAVTQAPDQPEQPLRLTRRVIRGEHGLEFLEGPDEGRDGPREGEGDGAGVRDTSRASGRCASPSASSSSCEPVSGGSAEALLSRDSVRDIRTHLDPYIQSVLLQEAELFRQMHSDGAVLSAVVLDDVTHQVVGILGSSDLAVSQMCLPFSLRSPGSALKPFVYALAFEEHRLHPRTVLHDNFKLYGEWAPSNFTRTFSGRVTAASALVRSLNLPALETLRLIGPERFVSFINRHGKRLFVRDGVADLSVILGSGVIRLTDLTELYSMLNEDGTLFDYQLVGSAFGGIGPIYDRDARSREGVHRDVSGDGDRAAPGLSRPDVGGLSSGREPVNLNDDLLEKALQICSGAFDDASCLVAVATGHCDGEMEIGVSGEKPRGTDTGTAADSVPDPGQIRHCRLSHAGGGSAGGKAYASAGSAQGGASSAEEQEIMRRRLSRETVTYRAGDYRHDHSAFTADPGSSGPAARSGGAETGSDNGAGHGAGAEAGRDNGSGGGSWPGNGARAGSGSVAAAARSGTPFLHADSARAVFEILKHTARPWNAPGMKEVSYKTGTSSRFTDALSVGSFQGYTVGVAVRVPDNRSLNYKYSGHRDAAPHLFGILGRLKSRDFPKPEIVSELLRSNIPEALRENLENASEVDRHAIHIVFPAPGAEVLPDFNGNIFIKHTGGRGRIYMVAGGVQTEELIFHPETGGTHTVILLDEHGHSDSVTFSVTLGEDQ